MVSLMVVIIAIILIINQVTSNGNHDAELIKCIAENSKIYVLPTCSACSAQKEYLGEHLDKFEIIDCAKESVECSVKGIIAVPTWEILGEKYRGYKTIEELKQLTGCE